ncbi:GGDEF domain-containing protein [Amycolatopsis minnesotensis]|uniref:GGDEF domain-containing protein n=2 Tax=Amycolatopsis minnesotensis TaxID=337894 RepID=A0ABN2RSH9_9PSEU
MSMSDYHGRRRRALPIRDVLSPHRWALWTQRLRLIAYAIAVEAVALATTVIVAPRVPVSHSEVALLGALAAMGVLQAELGRQVERVRRRVNGTPHINLTSVWTFAGVLMLPAPLVAALVAVLYWHLAVRSWYRLRRVPAFRTVLNASVVVLTCYSAKLVLAVAGLHGVRDALDGGWRGAGIVALTVVTYFVAGAVLILPALNTTSLSVKALLGGWVDNMLEGATLCLGVLTALALATQPALALAVIPPLLLLHRGVLVKQLEIAATTDEKTGLFNTSGWHHLAGQELAKADVTSSTIGVLMIDLDHFKRINDTHGHLAGDAVLKAVAAAITEAVRTSDCVGRFGGEEFVVLLPRVGRADVERIAERVRGAISALEVAIEEHEGAASTITGLSASIGAALYPEAGTVLDRVVRAADTALYEAKRGGRNRVVLA